MHIIIIYKYYYDILSIGIHSQDNNLGIANKISLGLTNNRREANLLTV